MMMMMIMMMVMKMIMIMMMMMMIMMMMMTIIIMMMITMMIMMMMMMMIIIIIIMIMMITITITIMRSNIQARGYKYTKHQHQRRTRNLDVPYRDRQGHNSTDKRVDRRTAGRANLQTNRIHKPQEYLRPKLAQGKNDETTITCQLIMLDRMNSSESNTCGLTSIGNRSHVEVSAWCFI